MCSTPKPKRKVKAKTGINTVGILSSISNEKRQSFALRANLASKRRIEQRQLKRAEQKRDDELKVKTITLSKNKAKTNQSWLYRLLNASFSEVFSKLIANARNPL